MRNAVEKTDRQTTSTKGLGIFQTKRMLVKDGTINQKSLHLPLHRLASPASPQFY